MTLAIGCLLGFGFRLSPAGQDSLGLPSETVAGLEEGLKRLVTIDADDAYLPSVLTILAEKSGFNIVTSPDVTKHEKISIHLKDTPIGEAMDLVVRAAGLSYEVVGNSFLVAKAEKLRGEVGLTPYVINLQYADAAEVKELLVDLTEKITVDQSGNKLLITTSPKIIAEIRRIIEEIDEPALQIMLEARIIEVSVEEEEKLGIDWSRLNQLTTIIAEDVVGAGALPEGMVPGYDPISDRLEPLDLYQLPRQMPFQKIDGLKNVGYFSRQLTAFDITLDYLIKHNKADVLANSQIATMNNRPATLEVIDVIPYILSAGGLGGQVQVQREEVGVKLHITPTVNKDGYITTTITPELSTVFQLIGPDKNIPWIKRRTATTTIRVKSGQTIIIAGLLGADRSVTVYKIPLLGDIPFIGRLFRHESERVRKTDLIIQVTPHIIEVDTTTVRKSPEIKRVEEEYFEEELERIDGEENGEGETGEKGRKEE